MNMLRTTFDNAGELYSRVFADWLHIHFIIRTVLLLLAMWLLVYLVAQLFQYVIAPFSILFYCHVILRAWNYLFVESFQEWIYIRYYSKDKPNFDGLYLRLCDKAKRNRQILAYTRYAGILRRGRVRRATFQAMAICGVAVTLWVGAFGLHHEYVTPALVLVDTETAETAPDDYMPYLPNETEATPHVYQQHEPFPTHTVYSSGFVNPVAWQTHENIILTLNEQGRPGARLRNGPGIAEYTVIEILWDNDHFLYLHSFVPDADVVGLYWLHIQSPSGTAGYISSQLVEVAVHNTP